MCLLHHVACKVACLGCSCSFDALYNRSPSCFVSPKAKNSNWVAKLGHVPSCLDSFAFYNYCELNPIKQDFVEGI